MFDELPETIPQKNQKKVKAIAGAAAVQVALVATLVLIQMVVPERLGEFQLLRTLYMAPPPPPPAPAINAAPQPPRHVSEKAVQSRVPSVVEERAEPVVDKPQVVTPTAIPNDIARIVESGSKSVSPGTGVAGGVPGGIAGGAVGGMLGGVLGGAAVANVPPPPPTGPVRVGGNVKEPKVVHLEQPKYPPAARSAHIEGIVALEATVTAEGNVEKVKVISGPQALTQAAADAVSHWKYEPTYLNGQAVPVILTARITFSLDKSEK